MPKIKNVSPFGDLDVPLLGRVVEQGSITEVTDAQAEILLQQPDNFKPWGEEAKKAKARPARRKSPPPAIPDVAPTVETAKEVNNDDHAA